MHKHSKIQGCDADIRELFHILLDNNRVRRLKKVVPKEIIQLNLFNSDGNNFDIDPEDTVNKVMTVVTKIKQIKKEDILVLQEKFERNRHKKNVSEFKW